VFVWQFFCSKSLYSKKSLSIIIEHKLFGCLCPNSFLLSCSIKKHIFLKFFLILKRLHLFCLAVCALKLRSSLPSQAVFFKSSPFEMSCSNNFVFLCFFSSAFVFFKLLLLMCIQQFQCLEIFAILANCFQNQIQAQKTLFSFCALIKGSTISFFALFSSTTSMLSMSSSTCQGLLLSPEFFWIVIQKILLPKLFSKKLFVYGTHF